MKRPARIVAGIAIFAFFVGAAERAADFEQNARAQEPPRELAAPGYRYQGWTARTWAKKAAQARRDANARGRTIRRLKHELARKYAPSFEHYFTIAALTYKVDRAMLERKGRCESVNFTDFYNETPIYNGEHAQGVMGFIPSTFNTSSFAGLDVRNDHLANIMAGAELHARGRGGEWACR